MRGQGLCPLFMGGITLKSHSHEGLLGCTPLSCASLSRFAAVQMHQGLGLPHENP